MSYSKEQMEKEREAKIRAYNELNQGQVGVGTMGLANESPKIARPRLLERIANQRYRAENESRRADNLRELEYLLEKNPDIARILDLLDVVKE